MFQLLTEAARASLISGVSTSLTQRLEAINAKEARGEALTADEKQTRQLADMAALGLVVKL